MKYFFALLLSALLAFLAWPYYRIYQIDDVLGSEDLQALAPLVDLASVRAGTLRQFDSSVQATTGQGEEGSVLAWLQDNLRQLGQGAVEQVVDLEWVRDTLRQATRQAIAEPPYYFMHGVSYAFFDGVDSFLIRLGPIDKHPTHVQMQLREGNWRVSGIFN